MSSPAWCARQIGVDSEAYHAATAVENRGCSQDLIEFLYNRVFLPVGNLAVSPRAQVSSQGLKELADGLLAKHVL